MEGIKKYLDNTLGENVFLEDINYNLLPLIFKDKYDIKKIRVLKKEFILVSVVDQNFTVVKIVKHLNKIENIMEKKPILVVDNLSRYKRSELIKKRIDFIQIDRQIYLPSIYVELEEVRNRNIKNEIKEAFTPSEQAIYLTFLYNEKIEYEANELLDKFGYSLMTVTRALNSLVDRNILKYRIGGYNQRTKIYSLALNEGIYENTNKYVKSPVLRKIKVKESSCEYLKSGYTAFSEISNLNSNKIEEKAAYFKDKCLDSLIEADEDDIEKGDYIELEIWSYDPKKISNSELVDKISLLAVIGRTNDIRVEKEIDMIMGDGKWYME
ncbi:MAG: hypothetical protein N4A47_04410 [Clostridia bacterium]|nr:hypothetical protein [Clostridia bacterium]